MDRDAGMAARWLKCLATAPLALALAIGPAASAQALVPYVFVPKGEELEAAGLGIAQAATRLLRLGQADDAARLAGLTVQLLPNDPRGWVLLAEAQLRSNQIKPAAQSLARAKQLDPRNAGIWFAEGSLALRDGQPGQAVGLLETGLKFEGKNPGAHFDLGNAHLLLNDPQAALGSFERASSLRKNFWEAINNQGLVLFELGRNDDAIRRWRRALEINPKAAEPLLALAAALNARAGDQNEALEMASRALATEPNYVLEAYQKEQLWGPKLRSSTRLLLENPAIKAATDRANANATGTSEGEDPGDE
ncbi:tetratricopeptide repeat protein [Synechococcus sp. RedBA-s]|uniref:tetratricopeptide repeat protein n=1 Tax=Synechococcus sp. RedBA-s TaxID=2823741 RepID=UPI0020CC95A5|nr:tetratricopeptide repeat protein [Synechococcus sp. RedBA-s]